MTTTNASGGGQLQAPAAEPAANASPVIQPENPAPEGADLDPQAQVSYLQAIQDNYSQYRATAAIPYGNALAFQAGDPVPADYPTINQLVADGLVERVAKPASARKGKK